MSLLFHVVLNTACRGTHPRIALDALRHLRGPDAERWTDLFLHHHRAFLAGSLAPDDQFKDFENHVLHVATGWGGAPVAARRWYGRLVAALRRAAWSEAVYAAGVLSHYVSDPCLPLHTQYSEGQGSVQYALEWSAGCLYGELQHILDEALGGYPRVEASRRDDWLPLLVRQGAEFASEHYQAVIDHYNLPGAVTDPRLGPDQECKDRLARCLGCAVGSFARVLERAIAESAAEPPPVEITVQGFLAALAAPFGSLAGYLQDLHCRAVVETIEEEIRRTGKALLSLPEECRVVRQLYAEEVLHVPLAELEAQPAAPSGTRYGQGAPERRHPGRLITSPVIDNRTGSWNVVSARLRRASTANREQRARRFDVQAPVPDFPSSRPPKAA